MKKIIFTLVVLACITAHAQDTKSSKWYSTAGIDFSIPHQIDYNYGHHSSKYNANIGGTTIIKDFGGAFGIQYAINYQLFKRLSLGIVTGFQYQNSPNYSMYKLGARLTYYIVDKNNVYAYLQDCNNFSLNKNQFATGNNSRFGAGMPIVNLENITMHVEVFWEQNFFRLQGSKPLLTNEEPLTTVFKSYGISLGIKF